MRLPKLIIRHNNGTISAAKSRLLLLGQCRRLHRSSARPTRVAFVVCSNLPNFSRNLASIGPIPSRLSFLLWHPILKVEEPESGSWTTHYWAMYHFYQGKQFWKWKNQSLAQNWPVAVPKTSVGGKNLVQNWLPSAYRSYNSSSGTILASDLWQHFCQCWASVRPYLFLHLGAYQVLVFVLYA